MKLSKTAKNTRAHPQFAIKNLGYPHQRASPASHSGLCNAVGLSFTYEGAHL